MLIIKKLTALGRPINPGYPTNRLISILTLSTLAVFFVFQLYQGLPALQALFAAAAGALAIFFSWAFGREIDPAHVRLFRSSALSLCQSGFSVPQIGAFALLAGLYQSS